MHFLAYVQTYVFVIVQLCCACGKLQPAKSQTEKHIPMGGNGRGMFQMWRLLMLSPTFCVLVGHRPKKCLCYFVSLCKEGCRNLQQFIAFSNITQHCTLISFRSSFNVGDCTISVDFNQLIQIDFNQFQSTSCKLLEG